MTVLELIRAMGWRVAVHNDYRLNGEDHTFWLFTWTHPDPFVSGMLAVKGEGRTDAEALKQALNEITLLKFRLEPTTPTDVNEKMPILEQIRNLDRCAWCITNNSECIGKCQMA